MSGGERALEHLARGFDPRAAKMAWGLGAFVASVCLAALVVALLAGDTGRSWGYAGAILVTAVLGVAAAWRVLDRGHRPR